MDEHKELPREEGKKDEKQRQTLAESVILYLHDMVYLLAAVMVVFLILFRIVIVSGSSMYPTLKDGDWLFLLNNTLYSQPKQGDIIVASKESFRNGEPIIKRVIATEGQTVNIDFEQGIVYVDGIALEEDYTYTPTNTPQGVMFPLVVEEGCVFAMGDNRNGSRDSRDPVIGQIDKREILGKALVLIFPGTGGGYESRDFKRIGGVE